MTDNEPDRPELEINEQEILAGWSTWRDEAWEGDYFTESPTDKEIIRLFQLMQGSQNG